MDERTDEMLIAETLTANRDAFEGLMRRHERAVFRVAFGFTGRRESALDVLQEVFTKAFESLDSFGGRSTFRTWVLRITYNESINWSKRARREASRSLGIESISTLADRTADPEAELISRENRSRLVDLIGRLKGRHRLAITLRYFEGCSIEEIAAVLGSSPAVAKNALQRANRKLRVLWRQRPLLRGRRETILANRRKE